MHQLHCAFLNGSVCTLESREKLSAIHELIKKTSVFQEIRDRSVLAENILEREKIQSTGFGNGVAVAHANYPGIDSVLMALGISRNGVEYSAMDKKPVHLLFLIASPPQKQEEYLLALSALVKLVRNDHFRNNILRADTLDKVEQEIHKKFCSQLVKE